MTKQLNNALGDGENKQTICVNKIAFGDACKRILEERERQNVMIDSGRIPHNCASLDVHPAIKISVLLEEAGEVCKAVNDEAPVEEFRTELIQLCAVAMAMYEGTYE